MGSGSGFPFVHISKHFPGFFSLLHLRHLRKQISEMMDFERKFFSSISEKDIHFLKKVLSEHMKADAVELALEKTHVRFFEKKTDSCSNECRWVLKRSENFVSVAWS